MHKNAFLLTVAASALVQLAVTNAADPGAVPFEFPVSSTTAKTGDYVLCPPKLWIDEAFDKGADKKSFVYYTAVMTKAGAAESEVKTLPGNTETIPNAMIVPVQKGHKAKVGDVLLTWWQSGSGMNRAYVTGGTPEEPVVRYLDVAYDNPIGIGKKDEKLNRQSFHKLTSDWQPGTAVIVKDGAQNRHGQLLAVSGDKVLVKGFGGKIKAFAKSAATPIPIKPNVKAGDKVYVAPFGTMMEGIAIKVDAKIGRVFVEYPFAGKKKEKAFAFGDVAVKLPK